MKNAYRYRIYPNKGQRILLEKTFGCNRVVWNDALEKIKATKKGEKWPTTNQLSKLCITDAKKTEERKWLKGVPNVCLQQSIRNLDSAISAFFDSKNGKRKGRKIGFPRFKSKNGNQSARFTKATFDIRNGKLWLLKLGLVKVKWSRELPSESSSVTISRNAAGQYHCSFVVETEPSRLGPYEREVLGVDLGIKIFAFPSEGSPIQAPNYSKLERKIARLQKRLARSQKGSRRRAKLKLRIAKLYLKTSNIRSNLLHEVSTKMIRENQTTVLEDLNVSGMMKNRRLSRAIGRQGWYSFRVLLEAKSRRYIDREVRVISRWEPTSQKCSSCGFRWGKVELGIREIRCLSCHALHDRDSNAAVNIAAVGAGSAHDAKRTRRECQTSMGRFNGSCEANLVETSNVN